MKEDDVGLCVFWPIGFGIARSLFGKQPRYLKLSLQKNETSFHIYLLVSIFKIMAMATWYMNIHLDYKQKGSYASYNNYVYIL